MGIIYRGLNKVTGKSYVGQTIRTFHERITEHKNCGREESKKEGCRLLSNSMKKHGVTAFEWEILVECDNEHLNDLEIFMIDEYESFRNGYNLNTGGGAKNIQSEETKEKRRKAVSASYDENFPNHPTIDLPKYMIRFRRKVKSKSKTYLSDGYKIRNHPRCKNKAFAAPIKGLEIKAQIEQHYKDTIAFLNELNSEEYKAPPPKEVLPEFIFPRIHGASTGYEVRIKGKPSSKFVTRFPDLVPTKLLEAIAYKKFILQN